VVVQLGIAEARVLVAGGLSLRFLGQWCHIVAVDVGRFHTLVVGYWGVVFGYATEVGRGQGGLGLFWWYDCSNVGSCLCYYW
jgi:hypothetical protein